MPTGKTTVHGLRDESQELERHLNWANEARRNAAIRMESYQQRAIAHYNRKTRPHTFKVETLVLKRVFENTGEKWARKLQANWKGPYIVSKFGDSRAYHLQTLDRNTPAPPLEYTYPDKAMKIEKKVQKHNHCPLKGPTASESLSLLMGPLIATSSSLEGQLRIS